MVSDISYGINSVLISLLLLIFLHHFVIGSCTLHGLVDVDQNTLGTGGQLARAACAVVKLIAKEGRSVKLKLPFGEVSIQVNFQ